jgi:hypothetical protein
MALSSSAFVWETRLLRGGEMKKLTLIAALFDLAAVLLFSVRPCAAASVLEYSVYYQLPTASATRQPKLVV